MDIDYKKVPMAIECYLDNQTRKAQGVFNDPCESLLQPSASELKRGLEDSSYALEELLGQIWPVARLFASQGHPKS
jgi:hypothetical protein